jgi:hypothetical protein
MSSQPYRHRIFAPALVAVATLLAAPGCNVALVDAAYHGEPMLTLFGQVQIVPDKAEGSGGQQPGGGGRGGKPGGGKRGGDKAPLVHKTIELPEGELRLAVVWEATGLEDNLATNVSTLEQSAVLTSSFPARYEVTLFTPPPPAVIHKHKDGGSYALGTIVAYVDSDNDQHFDPVVDSLIGGAPGRGLLYSPDGLNTPWLATPLGAGYHRLRTRKDLSTCGDLGHLLLELDTRAETHLQIFESIPHDVMLDLDCDGKREEWASACPPKSHLQKVCSKAQQGDWKCVNCEY